MVSERLENGQEPGFTAARGGWLCGVRGEACRLLEDRSRLLDGAQRRLDHVGSIRDS